MSQLAVECLEPDAAEPGRKTGDPAFDNAADAVGICCGFEDLFFKKPVGFSVESSCFKTDGFPDVIESGRFLRCGADGSGRFCADGSDR